MGYQDVGQARIFAMAEASTRGALAGKVESIDESKVIVTVPIDIPNGVRGLRADFRKAQFVGDPRIGANVIIKGGELKVIGSR